MSAERERWINDMRAMVDASTLDPDRRDVAMNVLRSVDPIANGSASSTEAQSVAILALCHLTLSQYITRLTTADLIQVIEQHTRDCINNKGMLRDDRGDGNKPLNKQRLAFALLRQAGWPGVIIWFLIQFNAEIAEVLTGLAR